MQPTASASAPQAPKQRKPRSPRPAPQRIIRIAEQASPVDPEGWFCLQIEFRSTMARSQALRVETWTYLAREIAADTGMGRGCRGFELEKLSAANEPTGEVYHVFLASRTGYSSCDCLGGEAHGHCKHRQGIEALIAGGHLPPRFRSAGDMKRNAPDELQAHLDSIADPEGPDQCPPQGIPDHFLPENRFADCPGCGDGPEPWDYPDEPPTIPFHADFEPSEEDIDPTPAA